MLTEGIEQASADSSELELLLDELARVEHSLAQGADAGGEVFLLIQNHLYPLFFSAAPTVNALDQVLFDSYALKIEYALDSLNQRFAKSEQSIASFLLDIYVWFAETFEPRELQAFISFVTAADPRIASIAADLVDAKQQKICLFSSACSSGFFNALSMSLGNGAKQLPWASVRERLKRVYQDDLAEPPYSIFLLGFVSGVWEEASVFYGAEKVSDQVFNAELFVRPDLKLPHSTYQEAWALQQQLNRQDNVLPLSGAPILSPKGDAILTHTAEYFQFLNGQLAGYQAFHGWFRN